MGALCAHDTGVKSTLPNTKGQPSVSINPICQRGCGKFSNNQRCALVSQKRTNQMS